MLTIVLILIAAVALFFSIGVIGTWHESVTKKDAKFSDKLKSTVKGLVGITILGVIAFLCIRGIFSEDDTSEIASESPTTEIESSKSQDSNAEKVAEIKQELEQVEKQKAPEFYFTVNEFIRRYNQATQHLPASKFTEKLRERIIVEEEMELSDGVEYTLIKTTSADHFHLSVTTNKNSDAVRSIYYMIYIAKAKDTATVMGDLLLRFSATIMAVENPNMQPKERGERLKEIGVFKAVEERKEVLSRKNNIDYKVDVIITLGAVTLSIKPSSP